MRFQASFADSCIGTRKRWGIDQGREMLRNGCGKVNHASKRENSLLTGGVLHARECNEAVAIGAERCRESRRRPPVHAPPPPAQPSVPNLTKALTLTSF